MVIYFINSKELLENLSLVINSKRKPNVIKKSWIQHVYHATVCMAGCKPNHSLYGILFN